MFIPEKLKLNKFKHVMIPRNRDYFSRLGFAATPASQYTGEEPAPMRENKIDQIEDYRAYAAQMEKELSDDVPNS